MNCRKKTSPHKFPGKTVLCRATIGHSCMIQPLGGCVNDITKPHLPNSAESTSANKNKATNVRVLKFLASL